MFYKAIKTKFCSALAAAVFSLGVAHSAVSLELAQTPLFLSQPVRPIVMLNMSNDHQLYFKAYDDYTDLTGPGGERDGVAETTYINSYSYYGYFDSGKCYSYESGVFVPKAITADHYCDAVDGDWSGNFLNWATMTRMDAVRKILYGGFRSTDEAYNEANPSAEVKTVLERAFLPSDAHSFAKYYNGTDIAKLTPFTVTGGLPDTADTGITLCNTTPATSGYSQAATAAPTIRVAQGNFSLWASNERWQCLWAEEQDGHNDNDPAKSGIYAYPNSPTKDDTRVCVWRWNNGFCGAWETVLGSKLGGGDYTARVQVCRNGLEEDNCRDYPDGTKKPSGLLQRYGEHGDIHFGLMTGSYGQNKSGGVLRKQIGSMANEVAVDGDGTFTEASGIIDTLNRLRIYGYSYGEGTYNADTDGDNDNCDWGMNSFTDGSCSNWGNPQSEIYLESLRYLAGKEAPDFASDDSGRISGLTSASWNDPISSQNYCAAVSVLQFNASTSSYDADQLSGASDLGIASVNHWTDLVGAAEGIRGSNYFVGENGTDNNQLCTDKQVGNLSSVRGTCPDAPRLQGSYQIAGLAHYARKEGIRDDLPAPVTVQTYGVALAPAVPKVTVKVPGSAQQVTILPACRNSSVSGNCAIVDFKIAEQSADGTSGKLYVNWEDSEQGGDFDQDMWGVIDYAVTATTVTVTTEVMAQSTPNSMGFGYVISGTTNDGFHVHSGVNEFSYGSCNGDDCTCRRTDEGDGWDSDSACTIATARSAQYSVGASTAELLELPLYYAAKWGGYSDSVEGVSPTDAEIAASEAGTYFYAIDPAQLEEDLGNALDQVIGGAGSASSVAANSTRLGTDTVIYQALFDSAKWSGEIKAVQLQANGSLASSPTWSTKDADTFAAYGTRNIYTYTDKNGDGTPEYLPFTWDNLSTTHKALLSGNDGDAVGQERLEWVRGKNVSDMRARTTVLGDIVNSSPVYAGQQDYRFDRLSEELGGTTYAAHVSSKQDANRPEVLYVNANDGMLHGFNAANGNELFAYIPSGAYPKLKSMTEVNYGSANNPHKYSVDGPLFVGDAYFNSAWHTVLVGTYGAGAKGLFALDVTNPASPSLLFELDGTNLDIGNILGQPLVAPTADGWKVILGNGYNSGNGQAKLIIVDLDDPTDIEVIATDGSTSNGLAGPSLLTNSEGVVTAAYAGDLVGNMWKFAVANNGSWGLAYTQGQNKYPLFKAQDDSGNNQPITSAPTLGINSQMNNAIMVYFGTGRYLTSSDNLVDENTVINSFYAIADTGERVELTVTDGVPDRDSQLLEKTITQGNGVRTVSSNTDTTWWESKRGWYMDLVPSGEATPTGERVISKPLLLFDRLLFPTLITSNNPCAFGGSGWQMELVAVGDKYVGHSIFGEDGIEQEYAIIGYSELIRGGEKAYLPTSDIKGKIEVPEGTLPSEAVGRMSWRQLR
ncbi:pilus assembly protein [Microbulbifer rhizosphaerae]|uniref:Type IV pilus assembly protein PilY1 n=1 Tax=Microbulbifer rhizosphaerae TaxID=1562603 RepID=A0A7W4ZC67_9GAMM|nr:PilC/PilY family type IV pilus protein [Microbulbifer rhizosphaerae]MBB3063025.1 type IV pilus assembly protein PilY1 [Microbulbifer rhizosphaerae]